MTEIEGLREKVARVVAASVNGALQAAMGRSFAPRVDEDAPPVLDTVSLILSLVQGGGSSSWDQSSCESTGAGWQDIATAPRDGTALLLRGPYRTVLAWWGDAEPRDFMSEEPHEPDMCWLSEGNIKNGPVRLRMDYLDATHWMPLPDAPATALDAGPDVIPRAEPETASPPPPGGEAVTSDWLPKPGERVRCISDHVHDPVKTGRLTNGSAYTVRVVNNGWLVVLEEHPAVEFNVRRFESLPPPPEGERGVSKLTKAQVVARICNEERARWWNGLTDVQRGMLKSGSLSMSEQAFRAGVEAGLAALKQGDE